MQRPRSKLTIAVATLALLAAACTDSGGTTTTSTPPPSSSTPSTRADTTTTTTTIAPTTTTTATTVTVVGEPGAAGLGDPYFPLLGNGGYDVEHYTIEIQADPVTNLVEGVTTIEAVATATLSSFNLDFRGLELREVLVDGRPADSTRSGDGEMTVTPAAVLPAGEGFVVAVAYAGRPEPRVTEAIGLTIGWLQSDDSTVVVAEPDGASSWFPGNDHPSDKATYTFRVTVPTGFVAAANGVLFETTETATATTYVWEMAQPMATYLATVNIGRFVTEEDVAPDGTPIRNFYPEADAGEAAPVFARTGDMIEFFEGVFGPYPFDAYGVVVAGDFPAALETQTLSVFGKPILDAPADVAEAVVAHEVAHQWFGDSVSPATWQDVWLNEGFATAAQFLWIEHDQGRAAYDAEVQETYSVVASAGFGPPGDPGVPELFGGSVYLRGGLTLVALRAEVGDEDFFAILRAFADEFAYGNASTADFVALAERVSGRDLDALFTAWLFAPDLPDLP